MQRQPTGVKLNMFSLPDWISPGAILGLKSKEYFWLYTVVRVLVRHDSLIQTWNDNVNLITTNLSVLYHKKTTMLVLSKEPNTKDKAVLLEVFTSDGERLIIWCNTIYERKPQMLPFMLLC